MNDIVVLAKLKNSSKSQWKKVSLPYGLIPLNVVWNGIVVLSDDLIFDFQNKTNLLDITSRRLQILESLKQSDCIIFDDVNQAWIVIFDERTIISNEDYCFIKLGIIEEHIPHIIYKDNMADCFYFPENFQTKLNAGGIFKSAYAIVPVYKMLQYN